MTRKIGYSPHDPRQICCLFSARLYFTTASWHGRLEGRQSLCFRWVPFSDLGCAAWRCQSASQQRHFARYGSLIAAASQGMSGLKMHGVVHIFRSVFRKGSMTIFRWHKVVAFERHHFRSFRATTVPILACTWQ